MLSVSERHKIKMNLLAEQEGLCANEGCQVVLTAGQGIAAAHLDHKNGPKGEFIPRGVLCQECNMGLGKFSDSVDKLEGIIEYLYRTENNREPVLSHKKPFERKHYGLSAGAESIIIEALKLRRLGNYTTSRIAAQLGVSEVTLNTAFKEARSFMENWEAPVVKPWQVWVRQDLVERAIKLADEGKSLEAIADRLGLTLETAAFHLSECQSGSKGIGLYLAYQHKARRKAELAQRMNQLGRATAHLRVG